MITIYIYTLGRSIKEKKNGFFVSRLPDRLGRSKTPETSLTMIANAYLFPSNAG